MNHDPETEAMITMALERLRHNKGEREMKKVGEYETYEELTTDYIREKYPDGIPYNLAYRVLKRPLWSHSSTGKVKEK